MLLKPPLKILKFFLSAFTIAACVLGTTARAQDFKNRPPLNKDRFSAVIAVGAQNYLGDMLPRKYGAWGSRYDLSPSITLGAEYEISNSFRARFSYYATQLSGNEANNFQNLDPDETWRKRRQLIFTSNINELMLSAYWDVLGFMQKRWETGYSRFYITPYVGVGFGYAFMNPKMGDLTMPRRYAYAPDIGEGNYYDRDLVNTAPLKGAVEIPLILGVRWQINRQSAAFFEASRHYFFTDYLDRVSNWNTAPVQNDGFINYSVGYRYTLGERL